MTTSRGSTTILVCVMFILASVFVVAPGMGFAEEESDAGTGVTGPNEEKGDQGTTDSRLKEFPNTDTWEWLNPIPNRNKLNDVMWEPGGDIAVIVGLSGLITEREGSKWTTIQSNTIYNLWHVEWRGQGDYALIVGNYGTVLKYVPGQAQHLDPGTSVRLQGVAWKHDDSYALICGWDGMLLKYNGVKFDMIETGVKERLYNVSYDNDKGWLISGENGILLTYDEPTGNVTRIETGLDDMLYSSDWYNGKALIVGGNGTILEYDGSAVTKVTNTVTSDHLFGVEWDEINGYALISGLDGRAMTYSSGGVLSDISPVTVEDLIGISFLNDGNDALVVGTSGTVFSYIHGAGWTLLSSVPFVGDFKDVAYAPNGSYALIVGSGGMVLKYDTTGLHALNSGTTKTLRAICWAPNGSYALIVGSDGTTLRFNGTNFTSLDTGLAGFDLLAVDFKDDGEYALIVGSYGKVLKWDGSIFQLILTEDQGQLFLFDVAFHPTSSYSLIVGASGIAYKCEKDGAPKYQPSGIKCLRVATGVFSTLRDVEFRSDGTMGMLVGLNGIILKFDGTEFTEVESEAPGYSLADVKWKTDSIYPVIVGGGGVLLKYSGYGAVKMPCPAISAFNAISWSGNSALVVGDKNQILRYESPPLNSPFASITKPGEAQEFTIEDNIEFSGFSSLAPDDSSVQFYWLSNISGGLSTAAKFTDKLPTGHHRITLYVNASGGRSDSDNVEIIVRLNSQPPTPVISSPVDEATYNTTDDIYFDASASTDPNGDTLSFFWGSDIEGFLASGTGFNLRLTVIGVHTIVLWAYDGIFNVSTTINITVKLANQPPDISIISPTSSDEIHVGDEIRFEATALDPDGDPLRYTWFSNVSGFLDDHKMFLGTLEEGRHMLIFHADDQYYHNVSVHVNITVLPEVHVNIPPFLEVDYPAEGEKISGTINVSGTSYDKDGRVIIVEYKIASDNWRASDGNETWSFEWETLPYDNGEYVFWVRAYDGENHTTIERNITIANRYKDVHVNFLYPSDGLEIYGEVEVKGNSYHDLSSEGRTIQMVEVRVDDGDWKVAHGTEQWAWNFKTEDFENGEHTLEVRALDDEGTYSEIDTVIIDVKNEKRIIDLTSTEMMLVLALIIVLIIVIAAVALRASSKGRQKGLSREEEKFEKELDEELGGSEEE